MINNFNQQPNKEGFFGSFGGAYIDEDLRFIKKRFSLCTICKMKTSFFISEQHCFSTLYL